MKTPAPGDLMPLNDGGYGVVLASSRHQTTVTEQEADAWIVAQYEAERRPVPTRFQTFVFHSHAPSGELWCFCEDPEVAWCTDGNGSAWRRVRCPAVLTYAAYRKDAEE